MATIDRAADLGGPRSIYQRRLDDRRSARARLGRQEGAVANLRAGLFIAAAVLGWLASDGRLAWGWIGLPVAGFVALVVAHGRLKRRAHHADRGVAYYERGLDRVEDRWAGRGEDGTRFGDESHPFAADLDLFGPGSLFQRINAARTLAGESTLAGWLKAPQAPAEMIRDRQAAVADVARRLDLREDLDGLGDDVRDGLHAEALVAWSQAPPVLDDRRLRLVAVVLAVVAAPLFAGWMVRVAILGGLIAPLALGDWAFDGLGPSPFFVVGLVELVFWLTIRSRVDRVLGPVDSRGADLERIAGLLRRVEAERFDAPALAAIRDALVGGGEPPSDRIDRLARLVRRVDSLHNPLVGPLASIVLAGTRLAFAVERWRLGPGRDVAGWIEAVGKIESFASLGTYAFENPEDAYAEIVPGGAVYEAEALGHPLLPADRAVRNSLALGGEGHPCVLVVSGSNMSGKSTMLRTAGVNAVLAMIGAPARAASLRLSPLSLGATLRVQDSLQLGASRFYAELTRLREVVSLAGGEYPLLFLLDEIFHGTNSDDRRVGAGGVVRGLIDRGAIGLVTTHDLALAAIADGLAPRAANVHFSDRFEEGRLVFDYRMRPGVVEHSNALALMRAVGLEV